MLATVILQPEFVSVVSGLSFPFASALLMLGCYGMLVLSRQRDESIIIGDNIVITVVEIRGDKVRLGIQAPTETSVHRQEVYEAIKRENMRAAGVEVDETQPAVKSLANRRTAKPGP